MLSDTDVFELLTACASEASGAPFAMITHTKSGDKLTDTARAQQLTMSLHARAGLAFHYQLFCAASDRASPLFDYEYVQLVDENPDALVASIRSDDQVHSLRLVRKTGTRSISNEMALHARFFEPQPQCLVFPT